MCSKFREELKNRFEVSIVYCRIIYNVHSFVKSASQIEVMSTLPDVILALSDDQNELLLPFFS